jgi:homoserine O-acetyltransferase
VGDIIVEKQVLELNRTGGITLECGKTLKSVTVAYETLGTLNQTRDNAILICHALSGDSHVAGKYSPEDKKPGWWDNMVGPGKPFDTAKYFIICSNFIGGCQGTTGPSSINPETGKAFGLDFPVITVEDMVQVQKQLIEHLGIKQLYSVAGGSLGGMQAMVWAIHYPDMVKSACLIGTAAYTSTQGIAFHKVGRNAIMSDPNWNNGEYYNQQEPQRGLAIARMIGHITYLSDESLRNKFSRSLQGREAFSFEVNDDFEVESYLEYKGETFVERFDANSYLYITKTMDYFDLPGRYGSLERAFQDVQAKFLVVSFSSDWLYPSYHSKEIVKALMRNQKDVSYCDIESPYGHDAFLLEGERLGRIVSSFLSHIKE